jgi:hypothetical protein
MNRLYNGDVGMRNANNIFGVLSYFIIIAIFISAFSGCSLIGLTVGGAADDNRPDRVNRPIIQMNQIEPGRKIELILLSYGTLEGKFKGTGVLPRQKYDSIFHEFLNNSNELSPFPAPGDTITILDLSGNQLEFILIGYGMGHLSVQRIGDEKIIALLTRHISSMFLRNGETISGTNLEQMISDRELPVFQTLILDSGGNTREVPADSIFQITEIDKNYRMWVGLAAGLAIDLTILALYIHALTHANFD